MSNEELAAVIRAGKRDRLMELWGQVRRFALQQARRWAYLGRGGVTLEDLEQSAFLALLDALEGWRAEAGQSSSPGMDCGSKRPLQRPQGSAHSATA